MQMANMGKGAIREHCTKVHDDVCSVDFNTLEADEPCSVDSNILETGEVDPVSDDEVDPRWKGKHSSK